MKQVLVAFVRRAFNAKFATGSHAAAVRQATRPLLASELRQVGAGGGEVPLPSPRGGW